MRLPILACWRKCGRLPWRAVSTGRARRRSTKRCMPGWWDGSWRTLHRPWCHRVGRKPWRTSRWQPLRKVSPGISLRPRAATPAPAAPGSPAATARRAAASARRCRSRYCRAAAAVRSNCRPRPADPAPSAATPAHPSPPAVPSQCTPPPDSRASLPTTPRSPADRRFPADWRHRRRRSSACAVVHLPDPGRRRRQAGRGPARSRRRSGQSAVLPSGSVTVTGPGGAGSVERRWIASRPSATCAVSAFSSSAGSRISQWAIRRSNSACGPPPS